MPYKSHLQFEVADFLYHHNQMSAGGIDFVLQLWVASLAIHGDEPPFLNARHMYDTINSTPLGDVPWESVSLQYNGAQPTENVPSWMKLEAEHFNLPFWFRASQSTTAHTFCGFCFSLDFDEDPMYLRILSSLL